jgi:hypothetical protein
VISSLEEPAGKGSLDQLVLRRWQAGRAQAINIWLHALTNTTF